MAHVGTVPRCAPARMAGCSILLLGVLLLCAGLAPARARACAGFCAGGFVPGDGATIPQNVPTLVYFGSQTEVGADGLPTSLRFSRIDTSPPSEVPFEIVEREFRQWFIQPDALEVGARYRLEDVGDCAAAAIEFEVVEAQPLPEDLGALVLGAAYQGYVSVPANASCTEDAPAVMVDVNIALSDSAKPWADLLQFQTLVDGAIWPSWWSLSLASDDPYGFQGGEDLLYAECPQRLDPNEMITGNRFESFALDEGSHRVWIEATLLGVEGVLKTASDEIELSCGDDDAEPDAGAPPSRDAGENDDAGADAGDSRVDADSGGCSVMYAHGDGFRALWAIAVAFVWRSRRRIRSMTR